MSTVRFGPRDVAATLIVAALTALFGLWQSGTDLAGMGSPRVVAAVVLVLGLVACAVGARNDAFTDKRGVKAIPPLTNLLSMLGTSAFIIGIVAIALGSQVLLTALVVLTLVLWLAATIRHLALPLPRPAPTPAPQPEQSTAFDSKTRARVGGDSP